MHCWSRDQQVASLTPCHALLGQYLDG